MTGLQFLEESLPIPKQLEDLNLVIPLYVNLMMKGNQMYQSLQLPAQQPNLEVRQVLQQHNNEQFQDLEIVEDLQWVSFLFKTLKTTLHNTIISIQGLLQCRLFLLTSQCCYVLTIQPLASLKATGMGYKDVLLQPALLAILITSSHILQEWLCMTGEHNCKDQTWLF